MQRIEFDPLGADFRADPYATYRALRERDAPYYYAAQDMWLLSRYADVAEIARDPSMVRSLRGIEDDAALAERQRAANFYDMPYHERFVQFSLLDSDGALHRRLRKQVFGAFQARQLDGLAPTISGFVDELLMALGNRSDVDFIGDFALHIPGFVIGQFLGVPKDDCPQLRVWSEHVVRYFDVNRTAEAKARAEKATYEFHDYLIDLKAERMRRPQDDLISRMITDNAAGWHSDDEFISTCMLILMAGHGSTIDVLGSGMHTLLRNPGIMHNLRTEPSHLPNAIEEMFRYESPLPFFHRHSTRDVTIGGQEFPAGTTFGLLYGSANRDPVQFADPDTFDPWRHPNRHLAFGMGAHLCLGNNLAKLNMRIIFEKLLAASDEIVLADENVLYKPGLSVRGPESLMVAMA